MAYYKNISYLISHVFLMLYIYLFIASRYSGKKTAGICASSFSALCFLDLLKLNLFPDSQLCYFVVTLLQIIVTQFTGFFISKKRDSRAVFAGLSASSYVIAGSVVSTVLYLWTKNMPFSLAGGAATHAVILLVLYTRIRNIWLNYQNKESMKSWWELCLIPVFFYCSFSFLAFCPFSLGDHPQNIPGVMLFIITMFISYVVVLRYVASESQRIEIGWKNIIYESYIKGLENQYALIEQSEKNLRILRHDMRHYSGMIDSLLDQGEYGEIKKITAHIHSVADANRVTRYCENLVVNTVLSCMMEQAQAHGVEVHSDIHIAGKLPVNSYELAMVTANLFENSLDCARNLDKKERFTDLKIRCEEDHLLIHIKNRYHDEILFDPETGLPKSVRGANHGLGMQSVQAFSDKIGGNFSCCCEDGLFHAVLFAKFAKYPAVL